MLWSVKEEGSATDFVTDVTDVSQKEEGTRKKEEGRKSETKINPKI